MSLKLLQKINQVFVIFHLITSFLKVRNDCLNLKSKCFHNFLILANLQTQTTIVPRNPLWLVPFFKILSIVHYKNGPIPASFCFFQTQFYRRIVDFSGIRTQNVGEEGEHADHLTTTTALHLSIIAEVLYYKCQTNWSIIYSEEVL